VIYLECNKPGEKGGVIWYAGEEARIKMQLLVINDYRCMVVQEPCRCNVVAEPADIASLEKRSQDGSVRKFASPAELAVYLEI
jgi:hypothetical protein